MTVIELPKLLAFVRAADPEQRRAMANDLSASANYVSARIPVGRAPKGLALSPDGKRLYVANRTDDTISVDRHGRPQSVTSTIALGARAATHARAPRRAPVLSRAVRLPGALRLRQLPPRGDLRRPVLGPGAGRLRQGHRGQPPARGRRRHRAVQVEWRQSRTSKPNAVRAPRSTSTARRVTRRPNWPTW